MNNDILSVNDALCNKNHTKISLSGRLVSVSHIDCSAYTSTNKLCQTDLINSNLSYREPVNQFTKSSAARMQKYLRECEADYCTMITLTYPSITICGGRESKQHLDKFMAFLATKHDKTVSNIYSSFWFMEFQKRGAIHYHIYTTVPFIDYSVIAVAWNNIVFNDLSNVAFQRTLSDTRVLSSNLRDAPLNLMLDVDDDIFLAYEQIAEQLYLEKLAEQLAIEKEKHLLAGTRVECLRCGRDGLASYAAKYAAKNLQKLVPSSFGWCGRFWGVYGYRGRDKVAVVVVYDECLHDVVINNKTVKLLELLQGYNIVSINDYYTTFLIDDHDMIYFFKERIIEVSTLIVDYYAQT